MAFEATYTPSNTETLGTKYQRIDSNFAQIEKGTTSLLGSGVQKITFSTAFADNGYTIVYNLIGSNGQPVLGWEEVSFEADGFTLDLSFPSIVRYIVIKN